MLIVKTPENRCAGHDNDSNLGLGIQRNIQIDRTYILNLISTYAEGTDGKYTRSAFPSCVCLQMALYFSFEGKTILGNTGCGMIWNISEMNFIYR